MTTTATTETRWSGSSAAGNEQEFLSFFVDDQLFGLPLLRVQDVLDTRPLTRIPLAPPEVAGALNLRGRIITAIDARRRLNLRPQEGEGHHMSVVVEHETELYNLIVDKVGDVLRLSDADFEDNPATLDSMWREFSTGVYRLEGNLMIVLDVAKLLSFDHQSKMT